MKKNYTFLLLIAILVATTFLSIGYATINNVSLLISGVSTMADNGTVKITSVTKISEESTNTVTSTEEHSDVSVAITASIVVDDQSTSSDQHYVTYQVTIKNDSIHTYIFGTELTQPTINKSTPKGGELYPSHEVIGIKVGDALPAKTEKTFKIKISLSTNGTQGTYQLGVNTTIDTEESNEGIIAGSITGETSGDLVNNNLANFKATVLNSHERSKEFTFAIDNQNFLITDSAGNPLGVFLIGGNEAGQTYDFFIKRKDGVAFPTDTHRLNIYIVPTDDERSSIGVVTLLVEADQTIMDFTPPTISLKSIIKGNKTRTLNVEWDAEDNIGIEYYNAYLYDINDTSTPVYSAKQIYDKKYTFENVNDGTYYITIEAYDASDNHASATSDSVYYTWTYTITITCTNCTSTNEDPSNRTVDAGSTFKATFSPNSGYDAPISTNVNVTMKDSSTGEYVSNVTYNYNNSSTDSNQIVITEITGDVTITATSNRSWTCLIEGTKFLMGDGSYKKIEDIRYDDLIMVYNHETGAFNPEYPIWIEKGNIVNEYQKHTFSDGSVLKTVGNHAVFSVDANEYIDVLDKSKFHVGTTVYKAELVNNHYELKPVTVVKTETIFESVRYYNVVSTRYYNALTENILTSDGRTALSNVYNFEDKAKWTKSRIQEVKNYNIQLSYEKVKYMDYYLYKGLRVNDAAMLFYYNLMSEQFFEDMFVNIINKESYTLPPPTNDNGNRMWMVTTSEDNIDNKNNYLKEEGSYYIVPAINNTTKWYCTADGNYYNAGDAVQIWHGMHFIKID